MPQFKLGHNIIGTGAPVYIIAEAGVNHNGDMTQAKALIEAAKEAGADCVKFQTFTATEIVSAAAPKANYQLKTTDPSESQLDMLKKLELKREQFGELKEMCDKVGIQFLSTPYSNKDADLLESLNVDGYKVASGQLTETPFIEYLAKKGKPIILSTGMANQTEVDEAVAATQQAGLKDFAILQCTTNYPSRLEDTNLKVITNFMNRYDVPIGYSDHTESNLAILGAVALGATIIEKHFTLDRTLPGPDHSSSIEPKDMKALVKQIRELELAMGTDEKKPTQIEIENAKGMKRSLAAATLIKKGTPLTTAMVTFKRPANGIPPKKLGTLIGRKATMDIQPDTLLKEEMISND